METKGIDGKTLILSVIAVMAVEAVVRSAPCGDWRHPLCVLGLARVIETALILSTLIFGGSGLGALNLSGNTFYRGIGRGIIWSVGFGLAAATLAGVLYLHGTSLTDLIRTTLPRKTGTLLLFIAVGGFLGPLAEELFFRGIIYGFCRRWGIAAALIISTCLFATAHAHGSSFPLTQVIGGVLFAAAYEIEKDLTVPITIHVLGNLAIFGVSFWFS